MKMSVNWFKDWIENGMPSQYRMQHMLFPGCLQGAIK